MIWIIYLMFCRCFCNIRQETETDPKERAVLERVIRGRKKQDSLMGVLDERRQISDSLMTLRLAASERLQKLDSTMANGIQCPCSFCSGDSLRVNGK